MSTSSRFLPQIDHNKICHRSDDTESVSRAELFFLSKEFQGESINWTDVQYELRRTRASLDALTDDQLLKDTEKFFESIGVPVNVNLDSFAIVATRLTTEQQSDSNRNLKSSISKMNSYVKEKIDEEFNIRFDAKNFEVMKSFEALDAPKECYLDEGALMYLVDHFHYLEIIQSILKLEMVRAKNDFQLELPISERRCQNLLKLIALKNTMATSTASVERALSAMNRVCKSSDQESRLLFLETCFVFSVNNDLVKELDIDNLIDLLSKSNKRTKTLKSFLAVTIIRLIVQYTYQLF